MCLCEVEMSHKGYCSVGYVAMQVYKPKTFILSLFTGMNSLLWPTVYIH